MPPTTSPSARPTALRGAFPALVTPLTVEREVDHDDVGVLLRHLRDEGAAGVLVAGSTGEGTLLTVEQRAALTATARAVLDAGRAESGQGLLLAGASGPHLDALHADVARLAAAGADAVLVLAPHTYPLSPDELAACHLEVAERAEVPTLAYHIPQLTGSALTPEAVTELARHPNVVGMKDSSPDAPRRAAFAAAVDPVGFAVVTGHAPSLAQALRDGVVGSITAIANVRQREVVALHAAVAAGDEATAGRVQDGLTRSSERLGAVGASMPAALKAALQLDGLLTERWCRPPLASVPAPQLDRVRTAGLP